MLGDSDSGECCSGAGNAPCSASHQSLLLCAMTLCLSTGLSFAYAFENRVQSFCVSLGRVPSSLTAGGGMEGENDGRRREEGRVTSVATYGRSCCQSCGPVLRPLEEAVGRWESEIESETHRCRCQHICSRSHKHPHAFV